MCRTRTFTGANRTNHSCSDNRFARSFEILNLTRALLQEIATQLMLIIEMICKTKQDLGWTRYTPR
ncbi:hypothetical protein HanPSC8_Chr05g0214331 [Helianthus annuus]|nr:hypothetical protein HanPSC8_Chr05g0214331 [Helianthus annuus]